MCRAGGRRCEHNWTQAQKDARNARRRALYAARSGSAAATASENSGTSATTAVESGNTPTVAPTQTTQYPSVLTLVSVNNTAAEGRVREYESAIAEIVERRE